MNDVAWADLFEPVPNSGHRVRCKVCHLSGLPGTQTSYEKHWQHKHFAGHPWRCKVCDKHFTTSTGAASHCRQTQDTAHAASRSSIRRQGDLPYEPDTKPNSVLITYLTAVVYGEPARSTSSLVVLDYDESGNEVVGYVDSSYDVTTQLHNIAVSRLQRGGL